MPFDVYRLCAVDLYVDDASILLAMDYRETLVELFLASPEGRAWAVLEPEPGYWVYQFIYFAHAYLDVTLPQLVEREVQEIVLEIFPRRMSSLRFVDDLSAVVAELFVFWEYLGREFGLENAGPIQEFLARIAPDYHRLLSEAHQLTPPKTFSMMRESIQLDLTACDR